MKFQQWAEWVSRVGREIGDSTHVALRTEHVYGEIVLLVKITWLDDGRVFSLEEAVDGNLPDESQPAQLDCMLRKALKRTPNGKAQATATACADRE